MILDSSHFPLFHSGQVFHQLVCPLTVVLSQVFFNLTTLFSYPVFFSLFPCTSWCCCSLPCISQILQAQICSFSVLSFCPKTKNFCSDPGFLLLTMFAKDLTGCFSHCCVEGGAHWIYVCIFIVRDGERCKLPEYHSLEGFQHVGIFQLFEVTTESCVFWLADYFRR